MNNNPLDWRLVAAVVTVLTLVLIASVAIAIANPTGLVVLPAIIAATGVLLWRMFR